MSGDSLPWKRKSPERADLRCWCSLSDRTVERLRADDRAHDRAIDRPAPESRSSAWRERERETERRGRQAGRQRASERARVRETERERSGVLTLFLDPAAPTEADAEGEVSSRPARRARRLAGRNSGAERTAGMRDPRGGRRVLLCGVPLSRGASPLPRARETIPATATSCSREYLNGRDAEQRTLARGGYASAAENGTGQDGNALDDETAAAGPLPLGVHRRRHWNADQQVLNRGGDSVEGCRRDDGGVLVVGGGRATAVPTDIAIQAPLLVAAPLHLLHSERIPRPVPSASESGARDRRVGETRRARTRRWQFSHMSYGVARGTVSAAPSALESEIEKRTREGERERDRDV